MIESKLRATFERHEHLVPPAMPLVPTIDAGARRLRRRRAVTSTLAAFAVAALVGTSAVAPRLLGVVAGGLTTAGLPAATDPGRAVPAGPLNFLLLGVDRRPGQPAGERGRADTIMVLHVSAKRDRMYVITLARDVVVELPGRRREKINAAYALGGMPLATEVVERLTGVTFDGAAEVRFDGLRRLTDALGGVEMCVDQHVVSIHTRDVFEPVCRRFNGNQALDYLRQRYGLSQGALDRDRHARQYLAALLQQATRSDLMTNPAKLVQVLNAVGDAITVDLGGMAPATLAWEVRGLRPEDLAGTAVPVTVDSHELSALRLGAEAATLFEALRRDDVGAWIAAHPGG